MLTFRHFIYNIYHVFNLKFKVRYNCFHTNVEFLFVILMELLMLNIVSGINCSNWTEFQRQKALMFCDQDHVEIKRIMRHNVSSLIRERERIRLFTSNLRFIELNW